MSNLYYCELLKLWKSPIRFLMVLAGIAPVFFTVFPQFMDQMAADAPVSWDLIILGNLSYFNLLIGIPLFYLITGYIFAYEYKHNIISQLFCYPNSRNSILFAKFLAISTCIVITTAISFIGLLIIGFIWKSSGFEIQTLLGGVDLYIFSIILQIFLIPFAICLSISKKSMVLPVGVAIILVIVTGFTTGTTASQIFPWAIPLNVILHLGNHATMENIMFFTGIVILILFCIVTTWYSKRLYNKID